MPTRLQRLFPPLVWLRGYQRHTLAQDILAACIMTVLVIPQSLAYALLAGLPPETGLYASILPLLGYALFASSRTLAIGPVALIALMSATAVGSIVDQGLAGYGAASLALALLSGVILFCMGAARLGFIANFISHPVISGFITGSALVIIVSQLGSLFGVDTRGANVIALLRSLWTNLASFSLATLAIGGSVIVFLVLARRFARRLLESMKLPPTVASTLARLAPMVAVVATSLLAAGMQLDSQGVAVIGNLPQGLPPLAIPQVTWTLLEALVVPAFLISLVIFVESTSIAHRMAARRGERLDPNQELMGLGAANVTAAFTGGLAVAGGFSRSVVNDEAGAQTQMASVFTAIGIGLVTVFFSGLFYFLPEATLAATIIVAVTTLVDLRGLKDTWRYSRQDGMALVATLLVTLLIGITEGIVVGVGLSLLLYLYRTSRPHIAIVGRIPGTEHFRNEKRYQVETDHRVVIMRVDEAIYFANAQYLEDRIGGVIRQRPEATDLILMCTGVNTIDASALDILDTINTRLQGAGLRFHLSEVKGPVMDKLQTTRFMANLSGRVFLSTFEAWHTLTVRPPQTTTEVAP
ncbi:SulP family inorganic anion transporter [Marinobacter fonticola]|uniref:SulP family inorganic anion transporter n=1 Tax=Marinobacter fonticola TaxID=2603215 RepID=UPI0011E7DD0B|nr:sulfate permease [Marinobacter fonticola]